MYKRQHTRSHSAQNSFVKIFISLPKNLANTSAADKAVLGANRLIILYLHRSGLWARGGDVGDKGLIISTHPDIDRDPQSMIH